MHRPMLDCHVLLSSKSHSNITIQDKCEPDPSIQYQTDLSIAHMGENMTCIVNRNVAALSLSFGIRSQSVCRCVLVVIDNLPLVHPRSMHGRIKSFISTITVVL